MTENGCSFAGTTPPGLDQFVYDPTGACHCQIMDRVVPGSLDMTKVKFDAQCEDDYRHNFSLLLEAFSKNSIPTVCTVSLVHQPNVSFTSLLCWFKDRDDNDDGMDYANIFT